MTVRKKPLTPRQKAIYDFIRDYTDEHTYPPSVREIGDAVGLASPSTVHMHLKVLESHGYINRDPKKPRTIEVLNPDVEQNSDRSEDRHSEGSDLSSFPEMLSAPARNLPLVGRVAAGSPILAVENIEELVPIPSGIIDGDSSFVLRVKGRSMVNIGIMDGDYIVVKECRDAVDGQVVVALIDDSVTVKTFYREKDRIRLQPENDTMDPIYVTNPTILGRVTGLIRSF